MHLDIMKMWKRENWFNKKKGKLNSICITTQQNLSQFLPHHIQTPNKATTIHDNFRSSHFIHIHSGVQNRELNQNMCL